jgi:hypothetical protein
MLIAFRSGEQVRNDPSAALQGNLNFGNGKAGK